MTEIGTRDKKITGDFGEILICKWLSRSGWEVAIVDQVGVDIIAYNKKESKRIGISVKTRFRNAPEKDCRSVTILRKENNDRENLKDVCDAFACDPWIGVYVETSKSKANLYLTSLENYDGKYRGKEERKVDVWKMTDEYVKKYKKDPEVKHIKFEFSENHWF